MLLRLLTQDELARLAHISKATVTTLEGGKHEANMATVGKLARAPGISEQELVYSRPEEPKTT